MEGVERAEVVSVEACREPEGGWGYNDVRRYGDVDPEDYSALDSSRALLKYLRTRGLLAHASRGRVRVERLEGDPTILEVQDKGTGEPLFAVNVYWK